MRLSAIARLRSAEYVACAVVAFIALAGTARAEPRRFRVVGAETQYYAPTDFHEAAGRATSGVSGELVNTTFTSTLHIPQLVDDEDGFLWELQYSRHFFAFPELTTRDTVHGAGSDRAAPAFGTVPNAPFEQLQILRAMWTWRRVVAPGYNLFLHNRTGFHGDQLRIDGRWLRVGIAGAFEREFSETHSIGAGVITLMGIGALDPIPFLRYRYRKDPLRIQALLPLYAHVFSRVSPRTEIGFVLEADGNRYRIDRASAPFDRVDFIYSYWGPSVRTEFGAGVFFRGDIGLSGVRTLHFHFDDASISDLDIGQSIVTAFTLSYEPLY